MSDKNIPKVLDWKLVRSADLEIPLINWDEIKVLKGMSKEAAESMNNVTVAEMQALATEGFILVCGNGQACAIVEEHDAERAEHRRIQHGY